MFYWEKKKRPHPTNLLKLFLQKLCLGDQQHQVKQKPKPNNKKNNRHLLQKLLCLAYQDQQHQMKQKPMPKINNKNNNNNNLRHLLQKLLCLEDQQQQIQKKPMPKIKNKNRHRSQKFLSLHLTIKFLEIK